MSKNNIRGFRRGDGDMTWEFDPKFWSWALAEAARALHVSLDVQLVRFPLEIPLPSVEMYNIPKFRGGNRKDRFFESIRKGTVLTMRILFLRAPDTGEIPSETAVRGLLEYVGRRIGLSPWGGHLNFGRFTLESLQVVEEKNETPEESHPSKR